MSHFPFGFNFDNSYQKLPKNFYSIESVQNFKAPKNIIFNESLAKELHLDINGIKDSDCLFYDQKYLPQKFDFIAQAYAGHQFGHFTMLGDGRAVLFGEHLIHNERFDIHLKGYGLTEYGRRGDGKAALGPMLREYLISEAMFYLAIPTTRSLSVITTGDVVHREEIFPAAILTRVAKSHIRVGSFQFAAALNDIDLLKQYTDYCINRHFPELNTTKNKYEAFLHAVIKRQAILIAQWMSVGFIHGVMNTDNMAISGETVDYGPCAFMNYYHPETVFSSIDQHGRYAYKNQPIIGEWNLTRFAESLIPLLHADIEQAKTIALEILESYAQEFQQNWGSLMLKKIGINSPSIHSKSLIDDLLALMQKHQADFTNTFYYLYETNHLKKELTADPSFKNWWDKLLVYLEKENKSIQEIMHETRKINPAVIARNHLVENALKTAVAGDLKPFTELLAALEDPFNPPKNQAFMGPPDFTFDQSYKTFCGT